MTVKRIDAFSLYLVPALATGTILRARNYRAVVGRVYSSSDPWPKLRAVRWSPPTGRSASGSRR